MYGLQEECTRSSRQAKVGQPSMEYSFPVYENKSKNCWL
jgi:hypothetical protein